MTDTGSVLRRLAGRFRRTPFHPQWLLGPSDALGPWLHEKATGRVLDIGCADRWAQRWVGPECTYLGLDHSITGGGLYNAKPDVFADAAKLPLSDESVDTVILLEVLEHLRQPISALSEIHRVLRPGGRLLLTMPFLYPIHDAPHDFQRLTGYGLERDIRNAGMRIERLRTSPGSAESAGLLFNIALAGMCLEAWREKRPSILLTPMILALIPVVNLASWAIGRLLPSWQSLSTGHIVEARKP